MKFGRFYIEVNDNKIIDILSQITEDKVLEITQVCERYGFEEEDVRYYNVYSIKTSSGNRILKKCEEREVFNYETYLKDKNLPVPTFFGKYVDDENIWILIEEVVGDDLRDMSDELSVAAAKSIVAIQNTYWQENEDEFIAKKRDDRFEVYWRRILRRASFVGDNSLLRRAYQLFIDRQLSVPRTLSNGDFLQFNVVNNDREIIVIDWGFGGVMPYSLDIARFIAHATVDKSTFPFYMNDNQKKLFLDSVYNGLNSKPEYNQFIRDIKLAILNEYIEFIEADEDENKWYYNHAIALANELVNQIL